MKENYTLHEVAQMLIHKGVSVGIDYVKHIVATRRMAVSHIPNWVGEPRVSNASLLEFCIENGYRIPECWRVFK